MKRNNIYIQLYSDEDYNAIFNNEILKIHYEVVRWINYYVSEISKKKIRINILLSKDNNENQEYKRIGSTVDIKIYFDPNETRLEKIITRYQNILSNLFYNLKFETNIQNIKLDILEAQTKKIIYFTDFKSNKTKNLCYRLSFKIISLNEMSIYIEFQTKNNSTHKVLITKLNVGIDIEDVLNNYINKHKWINSELVYIYQKNLVDYWKVEINGQVYFYFDRAEKGDAHGQYDLALKYLYGYNLLKNKDLGFSWLKKSADQGYIKAQKKMNELDNGMVT